MPLGKTPILQNDLMAEGDNNKYLLFNDALVALEDSGNRLLEISLAASNRTMLESEVLRYAIFKFVGHTVPRTVTLPITVGSGTDPFERMFAVRNDGTGAITLTTANAGDNAVVPSGETAIVYCDGVDVISLGGVSNLASIPLNDDGVEVLAQLRSLNFEGTGYSITVVGDEATIAITVPEEITDLGGIPALTGHALKSVVVNATEDGFDYIAGSGETAATIKTKYESNADTNAFTDAQEAKLAGIETGATADMSSAEIKVAYEANANTNAFTDAEKTKLAGLDSSLFKGIFATSGALTTAHPSPADGSYAYVDAGIGADSELYIWDNDDATWIVGGSSGSGETPASIKTKYESNADTNAFTDAEQSKLAGIEAGATADQTGAEIVASLDAQLGGTSWRVSGGGSFLTLADAPASYSGQAGKVPRVNVTETALEFSDESLLLINAQTASYTLVLEDKGKVVRITSGSGVNLTIPTNAAVAFPIGTVISVRQVGAGKINFTPSGGVTVNTPETLFTRKAGASASLHKVGTNEWDLTGDLELV